ncbi:MAG: DUF6554 family protein [Synechococcaceae cyanobacterium]|nr:DUF6554 family protein [Synechococcaceae cyanobacterium]
MTAAARAGSESTGAKGAQVYCFMRASGHPHEVSWAAAYALIKRQSSGLFKTSPEHGAVMITETVVQNPEAFPECGRYIGDLYHRRTSGSASRVRSSPDRAQAGAEEAPMTRSERYGY